jgi:hypothetical protein
MEAKKMNYDPNLVLCGRMAKQRVKLTFGMWEHRATVETVVGGNCTGAYVIEGAIENVYEHLDYDNHENKEIILTKEGEEELTCSDDEGEEEQWLKKMLIAAEIIDITPEKEDEKKHGIPNGTTGHKK